MSKNGSGGRSDRDFRNNPIAPVGAHDCRGPRWPAIWASRDGPWGTGRGSGRAMEIRSSAQMNSTIDVRARVSKPKRRVWLEASALNSQGLLSRHGRRFEFSVRTPKRQTPRLKPNSMPAVPHPQTLRASVAASPHRLPGQNPHGRGYCRVTRFSRKAREKSWSPALPKIARASWNGPATRGR